MKILFLDIDGVLNSTRTAVAFNGYGHDTSPKGLAKFDMVAVGLIRKLCEETGTQIVLSSSWRCGRTKEQVIQMGKDLDLPFIDKTPTFNEGIRGSEIEAWCIEHINEVDNYAIVDDDANMLKEQLPHFVQTDPREGLSWDNYVSLLHKLKD